MSSALDAVTAGRRSELTKAARALLRRPVLRAHGPDAELVVLVRRHASELRAWFDRNTGWRLVVDSEVARLAKTVPDTGDATHPARDPRNHSVFSRRRYVLACLALAVLERADAQITLGRLAEQIVLAAADPDLTAAGVTFALERREERTDLVSVVRLLLDLGVLARVAGDEDAFVRHDGDALYDVERRVLAALLASPRGPSTIAAAAHEERLAALTEELPATTDDLRNQQLRHRLTRMLLDEPVVYHADLDESELAYLTSQRHAITSRIAELTGLVAEVRAEGIAMVDPLDDLTDVRMPETGTEGHATLLLAEHLAGADGPVPLPALHEHVRAQALAHATYWRRDATAAGAEVELTEKALRRLEALRLVRRAGDEVHALPALARYAIGEPQVQEAKR
ncbi:TIGR02678 family protein [Pseudonocardia sp. MH-G8]|uniref:TIGR02678 family protein n=1 Tax=Pseudonocardia sp. MH-G8 TaxID=1854588 RepID=UPI000B9FF6EE|nr:TIGR02678 family protein [Pseudonocardia sp. MH-G8]OZM79617.1 TIGR02678 family protein [Pseudonocardia sp. MH-G8]